MYMMVVGTCEYTMTKYMNASDPCSFNVEVKSVSTTLAGQVVQGVTEPRFLDVWMFGYHIRLDQDHKVFVSVALLTLYRLLFSEAHLTTGFCYISHIGQNLSDLSYLKELFNCVFSISKK